jgi:lipopolysaccharide biosynthesis protein
LGELKIQSDKRIGILIHAYWPRELRYIISKVNRIQRSLDVWVAIPKSSHQNEVRDELSSIAHHHRLKLFTTENAGRDFSSFVTMLSDPEIVELDVLVKLHTKTSQAIWFRVLVDYFIGSERRLNCHIRHLEYFSRAVICAPLLRYKVDQTARSNIALKRLLSFCSVSIIESKLSWSFPAGSMFAMKRIFALKFLEFSRENIDLDFENEESYSQDSVAHLLERLIGLYAHVFGQGVMSTFCRDYLDFRAFLIRLT